jgi:hypothetical protein
MNPFEDHDLRFPHGGWIRPPMHAHFSHFNSLVISQFAFWIAQHFEFNVRVCSTVNITISKGEHFNTKCPNLVAARPRRTLYRVALTVGMNLRLVAHDQAQAAVISQTSLTYSSPSAILCYQHQEKIAISVRFPMQLWTPRRVAWCLDFYQC